MKPNTISSDHILYFSYGSNMSAERLRARITSARKLGLSMLDEHLLKFHKVSKVDNSGKCDIFYTGNADDRVHGVLYCFHRDELNLLDRIEGVGSGYERKSVAIHTESGDSLQAESYVATNIDPDLHPLDWYKEHVLRGAHAGGLPARYIETMIHAVPAVPDQNHSRKMRELAIYEDLDINIEI